MALADDIRNLADRSRAALDASHDYYTHTRVAWRLVYRLVATGRKFTIRSKATGTVTDQQALIDLAQQYVAGYLASSTFQDFIAVFEDFSLACSVSGWLPIREACLTKRSSSAPS